MPVLKHTKGRFQFGEEKHKFEQPKSCYTLRIASENCGEAERHQGEEYRKYRTLWIYTQSEFACTVMFLGSNAIIVNQLPNPIP